MIFIIAILWFVIGAVVLWLEIRRADYQEVLPHPPSAYVAAAFAGPVVAILALVDWMHERRQR